LSSGMNSSGNNSLSSGMNSSGNNSLSSGMNSSGNSSLTPADGSTGSGVLTSGDGSTGSGALTSGVGSMGSGALTSGDGASGTAVITTGENAGHQVVQWDGSDDQPLGGRNEVVIPGDPAHALGAQTGVGGGASLNDSSDEYLTSVNTAKTPGDAEEHNVIISDDGASGAS